MAALCLAASGACTLIDRSPPGTLQNLRIVALGNRTVTIAWDDPTDIWSADLSHIEFSHSGMAGTKRITIARDTGQYVAKDIPKNFQEYAFRFWTVDWAGNQNGPQVIKATPARLLMRKSEHLVDLSLHGYWEYKYDAETRRPFEEFFYNTDNGTVYKYYRYDFSNPVLLIKNQYDSYYDLTPDKLPTSFIEYRYNGGRLATETSKAGTTTLVTKTYTYDADGHPKSATDTLPDGSVSVTYDYLYDADWRLLEIQESESGAVVRSLKFTYDSYGDIAASAKTRADASVILDDSNYVYY
jgi:hypothetical protein